MLPYFDPLFTSPEDSFGYGPGGAFNPHYGADPSFDPWNAGWEDHRRGRFRDISPPRNANEMPRPYGPSYDYRDVSPMRSFAAPEPRMGGRRRASTFPDMGVSRRGAARGRHNQRRRLTGPGEERMGSEEFMRGMVRPSRTFAGFEGDGIGDWERFFG